jgi:hypothetical protein
MITFAFDLFVFPVAAANVVIVLHTSVAVIDW